MARRLLVLPFALLVSALLRAAPRQSSATPQTSPADSVAASVVVRLPAGRAIFHIGEEIPVELEFRGTADKDYYFSTGQCGYFTRLFWREEQVSVTPSDGMTDPFGDYFMSGGFGASCGSSWHALDNTPLVIRVSLNDAVRFTRPGTYQVVVSSTRLGRYSRQPAPVLTSAPIDLTIVQADDGWAAAEVNRAATLIGLGSPSDVRHGAAILRYLATQGAALALVEHYDAIASVNSGEVAAGLIASPHRALIIGRMEARVDEGANLDSSFLDTLTRLRVLSEMPPTAANAAARRDRTTAVQAEYDARWRAALDPQPVTAATLGAELTRFQMNTSLQEQIGRDLEQHPAEAADAVAALPLPTVWTLLQSSGWAYLNRPWIVPALRQIYARGNDNSSPVPAADLALLRLSRLAPALGRQLILQEIRTGEHRIGYDALATLPDAELPELDAPLQARYGSTPKADLAATLGDRGTTAWLIARYGSPALLTFVTGLLGHSLPSCAVEGGLIAYLLKHDSVLAMQRLDPGFDRTAPRTCVAPLTAVAEHYWDDRVESATMAQLEVADARTVVDAAQILGAHGSSAAKQPLIDRLVAWSAEWQGRAGQLVAHGPGAGYPPETIENNVVNALFQNQEFALTKEDAAKIRALCVTDQCRTDVDVRARRIK